MDGTIVDTEPLWMAAEVELMADRGVPWTLADHHRLIGMPLLTAAEALSAAGARPEPVAIVARLVASVSAALAVEVPWLPGVRELLADLRGAGVPCAMVTMSYRELAEAVAADAPGAFAVIVAGDEVTNGKPHPEAYLRAAAALGVPIEACVAIEDSVPGVAAAYASGARTIGIQSVVPVAPRPGLSRVDAVSRLGLDDLARVAAGEMIDLVAGEAIDLMDTPVG
jgi:HAD superfamily hydrolase (TIGR01509 family)